MIAYCGFPAATNALMTMKEVFDSIDAAKGGDHDLLLNLFDLNFGPWNRFDENKPFWGDTPWPEGAGFYPTDMTRAEYDKWLAER